MPRGEIRADLEDAIDRLLPAGDTERLESIAYVTDAWRQARDRRPDDAGLDDIRWMLEELRVSYFAQSLGTALLRTGADLRLSRLATPDARRVP